MAKSAQLLRLERRMAAIPVAVRAAVVPALAKSGDELAAMMRQLAPEDSGDLKESITVTLPGQSTPPYSQPGGAQIAGELSVLVTAGNTDVRYPHLQEYGTSEHEAQPFFWPSFRLLKKRLENRVKRSIGKVVRDGWRK